MMLLLLAHKNVRKSRTKTGARIPIYRLTRIELGATHDRIGTGLSLQA